MSSSSTASVESRYQCACRVVIKIGSSSLIMPSGEADEAYIADLLGQIADLRAHGIEVIVVSSGAIAVGMHMLNLPTRPHELNKLQACASVGQAALMEQYQRAGHQVGLSVGQVLLTRRDTHNKQSIANARATLSALLSYGVVPIVNENDTVSVEEICFGDNDTLSALVAALVDADLTIILSDVDGLFSAHPSYDSNAKLIDEVKVITPEIMALAGESGSLVGTGGMRTKLRAAQLLLALKKSMVIANAHEPQVCTRVAYGEAIGTRFIPPKDEYSEYAHNKLWLTLQDGSHGTIVIDDGARHALQHGGASLLPCGIVEIYGRFNSCDIVDVQDLDGRLVGIGMTGYSMHDLKRIAGKTMDEVQEILNLDSHRCRPAIYRDYLWVF